MPHSLKNHGESGQQLGFGFFSKCLVPANLHVALCPHFVTEPCALCQDLCDQADVKSVCDTICDAWCTERMHTHHHVQSHGRCKFTYDMLSHETPSRASETTSLPREQLHWDAVKLWQWFSQRQEQDTIAKQQNVIPHRFQIPIQVLLSPWILRCFPMRQSWLPWKNSLRRASWSASMKTRTS